MGGYAYAGDNPVADSDPTGLGAVGPPGSDCSTGTEYFTQCGGNGTSDTPAPGGGATGTATVTSSGVAGCNKFDCAYASDAWAQMAPTPGGWKSCLLVSAASSLASAIWRSAPSRWRAWATKPSAATCPPRASSPSCVPKTVVTLCELVIFVDQAQQSIFAPGAWLSVGARAGGQ
jgi:hypothetical protein